jgi:hypothetical protein
MTRTWLSRRPARTPSFRPALNTLERRETPAIAGVALAAGADAGSPPMVAAYNADGTTRFVVDAAYDPSFTGGVNVGTGDVNGDGIHDLVTGAGNGGGPHVKIFNGTDGSLISEFMAYSEAFRGGVYVEAADVNGDGSADIITGAGAGGGPHVRVFNGLTGAVLGEFMAYGQAFRGGVRVGSVDWDNDGSAEVITAPGLGGGPHVRVVEFNGASVFDTLAYGPFFRNGMFVEGGDVTGDGLQDILVGTQEPAGSHVRVFSGDRISAYDFWANFSSFGGIRLATIDLNDDGTEEIVAGSGTLDRMQIFELDEFNRFLPSDGEVDTANAAFEGGAFDFGINVG